VVAVRVDWKAPTAKFDPSVYSAPLGEGQSDLAFTASAGVSLFPYGYANAELGYRFRFENDSNQRDPGDEAIAVLEGGMELPADLMFKLALDALVGRTGVDRFSGQTELPRRRFYSGWITLLFGPTESWLFEASASDTSL